MIGWSLNSLLLFHDIFFPALFSTLPEFLITLSENLEEFAEIIELTLVQLLSDQFHCVFSRQLLRLVRCYQHIRRFSLILSLKVYILLKGKITATERITLRKQKIYIKFLISFIFLFFYLCDFFIVFFLFSLDIFIIVLIITILVTNRI